MTEHQAHARLSPSSSKGWLSCAGRIALEAAYPNTSNEHSDNGTACHAVAAMCLTEHWPVSKAIGTKVPVHAPGELTRVVLFSEEMAEAVKGYVDTMRVIGIGAAAQMVEHRVDFSSYVGVPGQFGTADFIALLALDTGGFELFVGDAKFGWHRVNPENNSQGMLYALGALAEFEMAYDIRSVRIGIYQPRVGGLREWVCSVADLLAFADVARAAAQRVEGARQSYDRIVADPDGGTAYDLLGWEAEYLHPNPNETDCAFCRAMATCPAMARAVQENVAAGFSEIVETGQPPAPPASDTTLATAMSATGMIEDWIKAVRAEVERRLLAQIPVEGWGLELGREGARKWNDPAAAETMLRKTFRLKVEDAFDLSLKSPTSVEKLTKKPEGEDKPPLSERQWVKMAGLISRSPAKPSVKPSAEIRKPYSPPALSAEGFTAQPEDDLS